MRSKPPTLTPDLRALCGRLANERIKPLGFQIAAETRGQMLNRLRAGEDTAVLMAELQKSIDDAAACARKSRS